ncbi:hypothetical protein DF3PB_830012 [uncultured Defluviicoccus sp.]|uniref:Uncharacterized protein n=1 Tax=metagenome TaxID=256318 RepID=A0A380TK72_9ZZZZ|nr:hypothetical protein DF3PB_830012 [uncultured Defluviicoccus sp.]
MRKTGADSHKWQMVPTLQEIIEGCEVKAEQLPWKLRRDGADLRGGRNLRILPKYRRIFAKVRDFLTRLGNALHGLGFNSVESIFAKDERGEVGQRVIGYSSSKSQIATDYLTGDHGAARYARGPVDMERAEVLMHPRLFAKLAVPAPSGPGRLSLVVQQTPGGLCFGRMRCGSTSRQCCQIRRTCCPAMTPVTSF